MIKKDTPSSTEPPPGPGKKPYRPPKLEVYGTIREITRHVGNKSSKIDPPPHAGLRFTTR